MIAVEAAEILDEVIEFLIGVMESGEHPVQDVGPDQQGGFALAVAFLHAGSKRHPLLTLAHKRFGNGPTGGSVQALEP